jgi:hypothetical protein
LPILIIPLISACGTTPTNPITVTEIRSNIIERPSLILPETTTITTRNVEWKIITPENIDEIFTEMSNTNQQPVLFALTTTGYENVSLNMAEIMRLVREKDAIIIAYKNYYEQADNAIQQNNSKSQN